MKGRLYVKNWKTFQHYSGRRPPWIKLHRSLLDDPAFHRLPLAAKACAPLLWLLASETEDGSVPASVVDLAFRTRLSESTVVEGVTALIQEGFLSGRLIPASETLAACEQGACLEKETTTSERETETPPQPPAFAGGASVTEAAAFEYAASVEKPALTQRSQRTIRRWLRGRATPDQLRKWIEAGDHLPRSPL